MKTLSAILIVGIVAGASFFAYNYYVQEESNKPDPKPEPEPNPNKPEEKATTTATPEEIKQPEQKPVRQVLIKQPTQLLPIGIANPAIVLKKGSTGDAVKHLQVQLNKRGAGLVVDGKFGALTEGALIKNYGKNRVTIGELIQFEKGNGAIR